MIGGDMWRCIWILALTCPVPLAAQGFDPGQKLFGLHCASCHGADGRRAGAAAQTLSAPPPDLTALSLENNGIFPAERIIAQLEDLPASVGHGGDMPVYGYFFRGPAKGVPLQDGTTVLTTQPVADLVSWLESQQRR